MVADAPAANHHHPASVAGDSFQRRTHTLFISKTSCLPRRLHFSHRMLRPNNWHTSFLPRVPPAGPRAWKFPIARSPNLLESMRREPGMTGCADSLYRGNHSFLDILRSRKFFPPPLICGAKIVMASREAVVDPRQLAVMIDRHEITVMQATPATWRGLLAAGWKGSLKLKILCGGEAMQGDLAEASCSPIRVPGRSAECLRLHGNHDPESTLVKVEQASDPCNGSHLPDCKTPAFTS